MGTTNIKETAQRPGVLGNILAIFAFLIVIAIGIWGAVTAFKLAPSMFSLITSPFSSNTTLTITSPAAAVTANENFSLVWEYSKAKDDGVFSFTYGCVDDLYFEAPVAEGGVYGPITCNVAYGVPGTESGIRLVPKTDAATEVDVPVTVSYTENGESVKTVTATISVTPNTESTALDTSDNTNTTVTTGSTHTTQTQTTSTSGNTTASASTPRTPADLAVRLQSASIDPYTGYTVVRFEVQNIGGKASGAWQFTADLPTYNGYHYVSPTQASLNSYDGIVFTLTFDQSAGGVLSINIDPADWVPESNESNNFLSETIGGGYYPQDTSSYTPTYDYGVSAYDTYYQDSYQVYVPEYPVYPYTY